MRVDHAAVLVTALALLSGTSAARGPLDRTSPEAVEPGDCAPRTRAPVVFEENRGQVDPDIRFLARTRGYTAFVQPAGALFAAPDGTRSRMRFVGAREDAVLAGAAPTGGLSHYLVGNRPESWVRGAPHFGALVARNVYPGVDVQWRATADGTIAYDLRVAPGADATVAALSFEGAGVRIDRSGDLHVSAPCGEVVHAAPVAFQERDGRRHQVAARFARQPNGFVGFVVGTHDRSLPLVIDPSVTFSTQLGGAQVDDAVGSVLDADGDVFVTGPTNSLGFLLQDPLQPAIAGAKDLFVSKLAGDGSALLYSTFLGGQRNDTGWDLRVDGAGAVYVVGFGDSTDFPVTQGAFQTSHAGGIGQDVYVLKLAPGGASLDYATYLGANNLETASAIELDQDGTVVVAGSTRSSLFPTVNPLFNFRGNSEAFVARLSADGSALLFSTWIGGTDHDFANGVRLASGSIYVVGQTFSDDLPTVLPVQAANAGGSDAFACRIDAQSSVAFLTYLGGTGADNAHDLFVDGADRLWVTGEAEAGFPLANALQGTLGGTQDAFLTQLSADGQSMPFSTYLGGSDEDCGKSVDGWGTRHVWVTGWTDSTDFPTVAPTQPTPGGSRDVFVMQVQTTGPTIDFATYLGGESSDYPWDVTALPGGEQAVVTGTTFSSDFPAVGRQYGSPAGSGITQATVTRFGDPPPGLGDRELYVQRGALRVNWAKHAREKPSDTFVVKGCLNRRGMSADLTGATLAMTVNGMPVLPATTLDARGKARASGHKVSLNPRNGRYSVHVSRTDLRTALAGLQNASEKVTLLVDVRIDVVGAGLAHGSPASTLEFHVRSKEDKASRGSFSFTKARTTSGAFKATRKTVTQKNAGHALSLRAALTRSDGDPIAHPSGDVRLTVGDAAPIVIPLGSFRVKRSSWAYSRAEGAVAGLRKFAFGNTSKTLLITTEPLAGTGVPAAGDQAPTSLELTLVVEIPAGAAGTQVFRTTLEMARPSSVSRRWK